jgi:hypothetical protein
MGIFGRQNNKPVSPYRMDGKVKRRIDMTNKINKELKDYRNECGDCDDGGQDCYNSSIRHMPERSAKATCKKCQCSYCTRAKCPPAMANKPKETPATFTQGEWRILRPYMDKPITIEISYKPNLWEKVATISQMPSNNTQLANAYLIAAAPEMLKALKQASEYCDLREIGEGGLTIQDIVDNAIAKAKGKEL